MALRFQIFLENYDEKIDFYEENSIFVKIYFFFFFLKKILFLENEIFFQKK